MFWGRGCGTFCDGEGNVPPNVLKPDVIRDFVTKRSSNQTDNVLPALRRHSDVVQVFSGGNSAVDKRLAAAI